MTKCFFIEKTDRKRRKLRRYGRECKSEYECHDASVFLDIVDINDPSFDWPTDDPRWPTNCEACGYPFADDDTWQLFTETLYRRQDTGEEMTLREAPPGAMWNSDWLTEFYCGEDGMCLSVRMPNGGTWNIDGEASNCTRPGDKNHKCWVRHGVPPNITVDKNGETCAAGAGSIIVRDWHGFLRNGELVVC